MSQENELREKINRAFEMQSESMQDILNLLGDKIRELQDQMEAQIFINYELKKRIAVLEGLKNLEPLPSLRNSR